MDEVWDTDGGEETRSHLNKKEKGGGWGPTVSSLAASLASRADREKVIIHVNVSRD